MKTLKAELQIIGADLVACNRVCRGIENSPERGVLPRCLYLEEHSGSRGCVVIGLNPGRSTKGERECYLAAGNSYASTVKYLRERFDTIPYYAKLTRLLRELLCFGPTIWTELVKCEKALGWGAPLPDQTCRTCASTFLKRELALVPRDWPVFAVGREAYKGALYLLPDYAVVGVPHPTSSRGQYAALFRKGSGQSRLLKIVFNHVFEATYGTAPRALWLNAENLRRY